MNQSELRTEATEAAEAIIDKIENLVNDVIEELKSDPPDTDTALEKLDALAKGLY